MKRTCLVLLLGAALLATASAAGDDPTVKLKGVADLTPDTFDKEHSGKRAALIEFYAPWCGHCKRLVPEYAKLGEAIANNPKLKNRVLIAKVDADAHRSLGEKFGVRGFPTLKWFPRGKPAAPEDYNGGRTLDEFLKFIEEKVAADAGFARVDALVPLAHKFLAAAAEDKAAVIKEAEEAVAAASADDKDNAALYVRFMKKAVEKGDEYIAKETERLTKMSEKPMSANKLDEVSRKISVLSSFTEPLEAPAAAKAADADEDDDDDDEDDSEESAVRKDEKKGGDDDEDEEYADGLDDGEDHKDHDHDHDHEDEDEDDDEDDDDEGSGAGAADEDDPYEDP